MNYNFIIFIIVLFFSPAGLSQEAEKSEFDLRAIDFSKDMLVRLDGDWEFYWSELIDWNNFSEYKRELKNVPGFWKNYSGQYSYNGYATYRTIVKIDSNNQLMGIRIGDVHNSYYLWVNGELMISHGVVSKKKDNAIPMWKDEIVRLDKSSTQYEIVLQISSYRHRNGGVHESIVVGNYDQLLRKHEGEVMSDLFLSGALVVLGMFFIGMFTFWKEDKSSLFFGLFAMFFSLRVLVTGTRSLFVLLPPINWEISVRIEYLSLFISVLCFLHFVYNTFPRQTSKTIINYVSYGYVLMCIGVLVLPGEIFSYLVILNNLSMMFLMIYAMFIYISAYRKKEKGAKWAVLSYVVWFLCVLIKIIDYAGMITVEPLIVSIGFVLFILSMSLIFASRFGYAFYKVEQLKENAEFQNEKISLQKQEIEESHLQLEEHHKEIQDSINYAKRIQDAIMPSIGAMNIALKNGFVLYLPKDVIAGDFFWMEQQGDEVYFAAADCTGHGVPGAMVSVVCSNALNKALLEEKITNAGSILDRAREIVIDRLTKGGDEVKDGMDISLCALNMKTHNLRWAGANNPLWILRKGAEVFEETKPNKQPIGKHYIETPFTEHSLKLEKGDSIYVFTDGYQDQFGGERGKKFKVKRLKEVILKNKELPLNEQKKVLLSTFKDWQGDQEQVDDVCVIGVKV